ncbi:hypothetical protein AB3662_39735 [Sorangium cellulosum]|uniref:hypothetical protein n=1 Tax=Sorangium cellulosum TaxID=56 RepID=UPI003D9A44DC
MRSTARALQPKYATLDPNDRVVLYDGPLVVSEPGKPKKKHTLNGTVYLRWMPSPAIEFDATCSEGELGFFDGGVVALSKLRWQAPFLTTMMSTDLEASELRGRMRGCVTRAFEGFYPRTRTREVTDILFHVANVEWLHGAPVVENSTIRSDRIQFEVGEWRVALDAVRDCKQQLDKLAVRGGYALTYVGVVERIDRAPFAPGTAKLVLDTVYWFLSFLWGHWTGPTLLVGRRKGNPMWERWSLPVIDSWKPRQPWAPRGHPNALGQLFNGLFRKLSDPLWERTIRVAIHWYVAALSQAGAVEGAIMMSQAAFELLWWTKFVAVASVVHEPDKLIAADKLRLLLDRYHIPMTIPPELTELAKEARSKNWDDGPQALTQVRNETVHPTKGRKARPPLHGPPVWEAWRLSVWYLEMCLLAILEYNGPYCPRIPAGGNANATKMVPWA